MNKHKIPLPILILGALTTLMGLAAGINGYLDGGSMLFPDVTFEGDILKMGYMLGNRYLAMGLTMLFALVLRHPKILLTAFVMRAMTELQDGLIQIFGPGGQLAMGIVFLVMAGLEVWSAVVLWKMKDAESG